MLSDTIFTTSTPLSDKEFVTYLLNELGPTYETFITSVTTHTYPISSHELYHLLLIQESRMAYTSCSNSIVNSTKPSANLTSGNTCDNRGRSPYRGQRFQRGQCKFSQPRGRSSLFSQLNPQLYHSNKPTCQVCNKPAHIALQCHFRFYHAYQFEPPRSFSTKYSSPSAILDSSWYPGSVATHRITHGLCHLNITSEPYGGAEQIFVGYVIGLPISNIGESSFKIHSSSFNLSNLLHVPSITKKKKPCICFSILH